MHRRYMAALVVAAIACGVLPAAASAKLKLGVTSIALQNRDPNLFYGNVNSLKMNVIRTQINWANIASRKPHAPEDPNDPAYKWAALDKIVKDSAAWATTAKGTVIYDLWGTPRWARLYTGHVAFVPVPKTADFRHFVRAVAKRYNGKFVPAGAPAGTDPLPRITHWEVWNEPNNALGLAKPSKAKGKKNGVPAGAKAYVTILNTAYGAIHGQDQSGKPKAVVIGGAVGGRTGIDHTTFYTAILRAKAKMDAISIHPYSLLPGLGPTDGQPGKGFLYPFYRLGNFQRFTALVKHYRGGKFPIWVTELAWQVKSKTNVGGVTAKQQSLYFQQAVTRLRKFPQVQGMVWYMLRDETSAAGWQSGLLNIHNSRRTIWFTWFKLKGK
jgi:hypothetical protein